VLAKLLLPFRLGLGGTLGAGHQWMSWIALTDVVRALRFMIETNRSTAR
jgi:NAD dependent epimerase/dehydratase family enzyme